MPTTLTTNTPWSNAGSTSMNFLIQGSPTMSMTNFTINGVQYDENVINFTKKQNDVMVWNITNQSMMAHPFHIHGNHFFITSINGAMPPANMQGRKDVVLISPQGGTVSFITKYEDFGDSIMPYMYHCHILSHEDNGMMGQFIINPIASGLNEISNANNNILVYPNPANALLTIQINSSTKNFTVEIFNLIGEQIFKASNNINIDVSSFSQGLYFIKVKQDNKIMIAKFMKQ